MIATQHSTIRSAFLRLKDSQADLAQQALLYEEEKRQRVLLEEQLANTATQAKPDQVCFSQYYSCIVTCLGIRVQRSVLKLRARRCPTNMIRKLI